MSKLTDAQRQELTEFRNRGATAYMVDAVFHAKVKLAARVIAALHPETDDVQATETALTVLAVTEGLK